MMKRKNGAGWRRNQEEDACGQCLRGTTINAEKPRRYPGNAGGTPIKNILRNEGVSMKQIILKGGGGRSVSGRKTERDENGDERETRTTYDCIW